MENIKVKIDGNGMNLIDFYDIVIETTNLEIIKFLCKFFEKYRGTKRYLQSNIMKFQIS